MKQIRTVCKSEVPRSKGMAAAGLQIGLEMRRLFHCLKGKIRFNLPRTVFGSMRHSPTIVLCKALLQVSRAADVTLTGIRQAPQNIRIEHREKPIVKGESLFLSPPPRLRRYGGHPSLALASDGAAIRSSLASEGWWPRPGSNRRHTDFQSVALPTELPSHRWISGEMVGAQGFEPWTQ